MVEEFSNTKKFSCTACHGARLKPESLAVKIAKKHISKPQAFSISDAHAWFTSLPKTLTRQQNDIAVRILKEINDRLKFLMNVIGLFSLDRASGTLSGGES